MAYRAHFDHERLDVYRLALDFVVYAHELTAQLPSGSGRLTDQLHRAATSIVLNIAEGAGELSRRDKARFYRMALRSATECAAVLDILCRIGLAILERTGEGREMLFRIVSMLTKLAKAQLPGTGTGTGTGKNKGQSERTT